MRLIWGFLLSKAYSSSRGILVSLRQSFFKDWQLAIFCRQCRASSSSFAQWDSLNVSMRSTAMETASVFSPLGVISVFLSYRVRRLMRYLEKAMLERALSVISLFFYFMLLFRTKVCRERLFSLQLNSSTPMSLTLQSSTNNSRNFTQYFERPSEQRVLLVMRCQLMLRLRDQSWLQASVLRKQDTPSSSTDVACRSNTFKCRTKADSDKMTRPSLETSELPKRMSSSSLPSQGHLAISTKESSVI